MKVRIAAVGRLRPGAEIAPLVLVEIEKQAVWLE